MLPACATVERPLADNPSLHAVNIRDHQEQAVALLSESTDLSKINKVIEVGGSIGANFAKRFPDAEYLNLDLEPGDGKLPTLACDVTKRIPLASNSVDLVYSNNCFEHINAPWLAAQELTRILMPGGFAFISAPWSWRYHPVPIDYWRFSPEALEYLFGELETVAKGFNTAFRRDDMKGFWPNKMDKVPEDELGGFRENWLSFYFARKGKPSSPPWMRSVHFILNKIRSN